MDDEWCLMWATPCHKPPMTGNDLFNPRIFHWMMWDIYIYMRCIWYTDIHIEFVGKYTVINHQWLGMVAIQTLKKWWRLGDGLWNCCNHIGEINDMIDPDICGGNIRVYIYIFITNNMHIHNSYKGKTHLSWNDMPVINADAALFQELYMLRMIVHFPLAKPFAESTLWDYYRVVPHS